MTVEWYNRVQDFLTGNLSPAEKAQFEAECAANPEWAEALEREKQLKAVVEVDEYLRMKKMLAESGEEPVVIPAKHWLSRWPRVAAYVIILYHFQLNLMHNPDPEKGGSIAFYHESIESSGTRGNSNEENQAVIRAYQNEDWKKTRLLASEAIQNDSTDPALHRLLGHSHFHLRQYDLAEKEFAQAAILTEGTTSEHDLSLYYQALALIQLDRTPEAKEKLLMIESPQLKFNNFTVKIINLIQLLD